jgi:hypothetical protein
MQQQNSGQTEEPPRGRKYPEKYSLRKYLVEKPDPELRPVLHLIRYRNWRLRSPRFMDQRSILHFLNRKGLIAQLIHEDLVGTLGEEASAYSTVTHYLRAARITPRDATIFSAAISPHIDDLNEAILRTLPQLPFSSVPKLLCATRLSKIMVHRKLPEKLGFTASHLRWPRHIPSDDQKAKRVQCSKCMLTILLA